MTDRPILFKDRLVRAILEDLKTQTRRVGPAAKRWLKAEAGDRLWVREAWKTGPDGFRYRADYTTPENYAWKPSIHMPRTASRITLELREKPRLEPLQVMRHDDFLAEGIDRTNSSVGWIVRDRFRLLWDSVNLDRGFGWDKNPDVVVLTFRRVP